MKSLFFIFILVSFVASSCKKQYQSATNSKLESKQIVNDDNNFSDKSILEPIDTTEFITYWQEFRRAVINHDVDLLHKKKIGKIVIDVVLLLMKKNILSVSLLKKIQWFILWGIG